MKKTYCAPDTCIEFSELSCPLFVIAPSGKTEEQIDVPDNPPIDEDPNAAPLREEQNPWSNGLW